MKSMANPQFDPWFVRQMLRLRNESKGLLFGWVQSNKVQKKNDEKNSTGMEPPRSPGTRSRRDQSTRATWSMSAAGCRPSTRGAGAGAAPLGMNSAPIVVVVVVLLLPPSFSGIFGRGVRESTNRGGTEAEEEGDDPSLALSCSLTLSQSLSISSSDHTSPRIRPPKFGTYSHGSRRTVADGETESRELRGWR